MNDAPVDGRYQLLDLVGTGGEAHVFRARDLQTDESVAVRMPLSPRQTPPPTIDIADAPAGWVRFIHWGDDPQHGSYQVFELATGPTLHDRGHGGPLGQEGWLRFVQESLDAVGDLHAAGFIHGDLNARNFVQATDDPDARWILIELPFFRFSPPRERSTMFGSIHTLSPEQLSGQAPDIRTDIYALGCLYYYAACGAYPHPGSSSQEIAVSRLCHEPVPLAEAAPDFPAEWAEWIITGFLPRDPVARFDSIAHARTRLGVA